MPLVPVFREILISLVIKAHDWIPVHAALDIEDDLYLENKV